MKTLENTQSELRESWLTRNLPCIGDNYERRELLLIKIKRQRNTKDQRCVCPPPGTALGSESPFQKGEDYFGCDGGGKLRWIVVATSLVDLVRG